MKTRIISALIGILGAFLIHLISDCAIWLSVLIGVLIYNFCILYIVHFRNNSYKMNYNELLKSAHSNHKNSLIILSRIIGSQDSFIRLRNNFTLDDSENTFINWDYIDYINSQPLEVYGGLYGDLPTGKMLEKRLINEFNKETWEAPHLLSIALMICHSFSELEAEENKEKTVF